MAGEGKVSAKGVSDASLATSGLPRITTKCLSTAHPCPLLSIPYYYQDAARKSHSRAKGHSAIQLSLHFGLVWFLRLPFPCGFKQQ